MKELDGDDVLLGKLGCGGDGFEWRCMKLWKSCDKSCGIRQWGKASWKSEKHEA
jgi:hypothetical protein